MDLRRGYGISGTASAERRGAWCCFGATWGTAVVAPWLAACAPAGGASLAADPDDSGDVSNGGQGGTVDGEPPEGGNDSGGGDASCPAGFALDAGVCVDVDECELASDDCRADTECINVDGTFRCVCPAGSTDTGDACVEPALGTLTVFVVDIGQGDASVVLGPTMDGRRKALVMDAGNRYPDGGRIVGDLLTEQGVTQLDYVVLSHFDGDHIGGFVTVSGSTSLLWQSESCEPTPWFPTHSIYDQGTDTNVSASSTQWRTCVPLIAGPRHVAHVHVEGGMGVGTDLDLGGGYGATIVAGDGYVLDRVDRVANVNTPNERSLALMVHNDTGFEMLITGDLIGRTAGAENAQVEGALGTAIAARGVAVEVLRTGHHGAANASAPEFLARIAPQVAIISTGDDQPSNYHHPRCEAYDSLFGTSIGYVLQTELGNSDCAGALPGRPMVVDGTIRVDVTGDGYTVASHGAVSPANGNVTADIDIALVP